MCPNDDAPMQTLERSGVQFDMCPKCRGVWLDRGELEKLMEAAMDEGRASAPAAYAPPPQPGYAAPPPQAHPQSHSQPWGGGGGYRDDDRRYKDDRYRDDHRHGYKKKKRDSIFDIFD